MGRRPLGETPMSAAERQRLRRERIKMRGLTVEYVNRDLQGDYYNVDARLAKSIKSLIAEGVISHDLALTIISKAIAIIAPKNRVDSMYIHKMLLNYLNIQEE